MKTPASQTPSRRGDFTGPLFVVGMPRSGTKLMRALLNQHPDISLTLAESECIPYFIKKFGNPPRFSRTDDLERFVDQFLRTSFLRKMQAAGYDFNRAEFYRVADPASWSSIFEYLFRSFGSKKGRRDVIWGDKTPGYLNHMPLLRELFPTAKFIHMIRDPRDYCLSVRKSWGKSLYRAADRWRESVSRACRYGRCAAADYAEIHYETLLQDPEKVLRHVASFVGCSYDERMLELETSHEDVGDAKGKSGIVTENTKKYLTQLRPEEVKRIEGIVCNVALSTNYGLENDVSYRPLSRVSLLTFHVYDGYASVRLHARREGTMIGGIKSFLNHYTKNSWR